MYTERKVSIADSYQRDVCFWEWNTTIWEIFAVKIVSDRHNHSKSYLLNIITIPTFNIAILDIRAGLKTKLT